MCNRVIWMLLIRQMLFFPMTLTIIDFPTKPIDDFAHVLLAGLWGCISQ